MLDFYLPGITPGILPPLPYNRYCRCKKTFYPNNGYVVYTGGAKYGFAIENGRFRVHQDDDSGYLYFDRKLFNEFFEVIK